MYLCPITHCHFHYIYSNDSCPYSALQMNQNNKTQEEILKITNHINKSISKRGGSAT